MSDVQRILIVTKSRYLGDTIVAVPAMRALAARYPQAHISLLSNPAAGELLRGCPYVHEYLARPVAARRRTDLEMWRVLRRKKYDMAVLFNRSLSSAVLAFMARIPQRVGFDTEGRGFADTAGAVRASQARDSAPAGRSGGVWRARPGHAHGTVGHP